MRNNKGQFVKGHKENISTSVEKPCDFCGKKMIVQPHRFKSNRGKFCSVKCRNMGIFTKEVRLKMSLVRKGKPTPYNQGDKCHFWKGGVTSINKKIRMSLDTRVWRESVFKRDNWTCQYCYQKGGKLQADHIKPFCKFPELRFAIDNGRTLCVPCHRKTDTYGRKALK